MKRLNAILKFMMNGRAFVFALLCLCLAAGNTILVWGENPYVQFHECVFQHGGNCNGTPGCSLNNKGNCAGFVPNDPNLTYESGKYQTIEHWQCQKDIDYDCDTIAPDEVPCYSVQWHKDANCKGAEQCVLTGVIIRCHFTYHHDPPGS